MGIEDFLSAIFSPGNKGYIEIRAIRNGETKQYFYPSIDIDTLLKVFPTLHKLNGEGYNIYFGVCIRKKKEGNKRAIEKVSVLWADIDCKAITQEEALERLKNFPIEANFVVDSG